MVDPVRGRAPPSQPTTAGEAWQSMWQSSQDLFASQLALLRHDAEAAVGAAMRRVMCNAAALWCGGIALVCGTAALYLESSPLGPPEAAAAFLGMLQLGAAALFRAAPRAPAALRQAQQTLEASADDLRRDAQGSP